MAAVTIELMRHSEQVRGKRRRTKSDTSLIKVMTKYDTVSVTVDRAMRFLSSTRFVKLEIPIPCMNREMTPMYESIIPFCSGSMPNCSMAIIENID